MQTFLRIDKTPSGKYEGSDPTWHDNIILQKIVEIRRAKTPSNAESILTRTKIPSIVCKGLQAVVAYCGWKVVQVVRDEKSIEDESTREMVWVFVLKEPEFEDELFTKKEKKPSDYFK